MAEDALDPPKRPAPEEPFVQVSHQDTVLSREALQQLFDLKPPFPGLQSEVGGDHLKPFPITDDLHIDRATRFPSRLTEVYQSHFIG